MDLFANVGLKLGFSDVNIYFYDGHCFPWESWLYGLTEFLNRTMLHMWFNESSCELRAWALVNNPFWERGSGLLSFWTKGEFNCGLVQTGILIGLVYIQMVLIFNDLFSLACVALLITLEMLILLWKRVYITSLWVSLLCLLMSKFTCFTHKEEDSSTDVRRRHWGEDWGDRKVVNPPFPTFFFSQDSTRMMLPRRGGVGGSILTAAYFSVTSHN